MSAGPKMDIDALVLDAVGRMAPVTRKALREALKPLTHDQVDGGISRTMGRGLVVSVAKADIAPRGPAGRQYLLAENKKFVQPAQEKPESFADWMKVPSLESPNGWPPHFVPRFSATISRVALLQAPGAAA